MDFNEKVLTLSELGTLCKERGRQSTHEKYCFELFRRAIEEKNQKSWEILYMQYKMLVLQWVHRITLPEHIEIEDVVQQIFLEFNRAYTADKLAKAEGLASILAYLKSCAISTSQHIRRKAKLDTIRISNDGGESGENLAQALNNEWLWKMMESLCHDEKELTVMRTAFILDMKPIEVMTIYPHLFETPHDVSQIKQRVLFRLKRHPKLKQFLID